MLQYLKQEANQTVTENGAVTHLTTESDCLDLFATIGALRHASEGEIEARFLRAYTENRSLAMKLLFFARDIRGGLGERKVFRVILKWLAENEPASVEKNLAYVAEYGRYDDLLVLMDTPCEKAMLAYIKEQLLADLAAMEKGDAVSLLAKWLPSVNTSNLDTVCLAKRIAKAFGMRDAEYRKALVALRSEIRILENKLRLKDYTFDYAKQPSKAMFKYRKAFLRNDKERYSGYLLSVRKGEATLHATTLAPYELVDPFVDDAFYSRKNGFMRPISDEEKAALNATWASLPVYHGDDNALAVIDTSGSMYWAQKPKPASVALSLGLYLAEHSKGCYHNTFIEFSAKPRLIELKGETFADRLRYAASFNEVANTNLEAVFDLVLNTAVKHKLSENELPKKLYVISDMEFDACTDHADRTVFENAKLRFEKAGYKLPEIVFWNVASRNRQQPVKKNERGVILVSGCTPHLFEMMVNGTADPYTFMLEVVGSERYADIVA